MATSILDTSIIIRDVDTRLHNVERRKQLEQLLCNPSIDVNCQQANGDTPLHTYVRRGHNGYELLLTLLSLSNPNSLDLDKPDETKNTPLHLAALLDNIDATKALITFGADVDALNINLETPLDIARNNNHDDLADLLVSVGSVLGTCVIQRLENFVSLPQAPVYNERELENNLSLSSSIDLSLSSSFSLRAEESYSVWQQWITNRRAMRESKQKKKQSRRNNYHSQAPPIFNKGDRVLCLDGGGMKGLIQIEVLSHITEATGRNIPELFDWIVGTSTGGIVALALVYAHLNIACLRKLFFEIKDKVFGKMTFGMRCDTKALEDILIREFKDDTMTALPYGPKVLISAVDKSTDKLELCWFNNCFHDNLYGQPLWKVARCTSAAPCFFQPMDQYIDGGLRANNPSEDALTRIQHYRQEMNHRSRLGLVVSVGCGTFPSALLGDVNVDKYLAPGKHWFFFKKIRDDFKNLKRMLLAAINNSEQATENSRSRCQEQGIAFYRFSPMFEEDIPLSETDDKKLCNMVINARAHLFSKQTHMEEIIQSFYCN